MYVWHVPLAPDNMEDLGCEVEMVYGTGPEDDPIEKYIAKRPANNFIVTVGGFLHIVGSQKHSHAA